MRRIAIRPGLLLLVVVLGEPSGIAGQQRQVPGTFRSTTLVVPVDVRALTYVKRIPATTYPWMVKVVVYDYAGDVVGSTETRIY